MSEPIIAETFDPAPDIPPCSFTFAKLDADAKTHALGYFHSRIKQSNQKLDFGRFKNNFEKHSAFQDWDKNLLRQLYAECLEQFPVLVDAAKKELGKSRSVF